MTNIRKHIDKQDGRILATVILFGLVAHAFMLTNKICFAGDAGGLFRKGDTVVSGRWGLGLTSYIMPDVSMPWLNGLMSLVIIGIAVCLIIRMFEIKGTLMQTLVCALIICSPSQTATFCYIYTCAPYALSMLFAVSAVYVFTRGFRLRWVVSPILIICSCSIYQGYFAFASGFCVIYLIKQLLEGELSAAEVFRNAVKLFAMLVIGVGLYGISAYVVSHLVGIRVLNVFNHEQGFLMRIAVAYSAYIKTFLKGYFAYVNCGGSLVMHLVLLAAAGISVLTVINKSGKDFGRIALLLFLLAIYPLSCYCIYMLADNGYIHSLALYPFMSLYVLLAVIFEGHTPVKLSRFAPALQLAMAVIVVCNVYFSNSLYLFLHIQFEELKSYYTSMMTVVMQTEGFEEGTELALCGNEPELRYDLASNFDFSGFQDPDMDIKSTVHAEGIINSFVGLDIPFASEDTVEQIEQTAEYEQMAVYPYHGSVAKIGDCIVVKLGE